MEQIRVMLVEDHVLVRQGTRELLEQAEDITVVADTGDGQTAISLARAHRPDIVLMDIALPEIDGLEATRRIKAEHPDIAILVLSAYDDDQYIFAVLQAGAAGYLLKDISSDELLKAIRAVHAGESALHTAVARKVTDYFAHGEEQSASDEIELTEREMEVLKLAAQSLRNREIAEKLTLSVRTVQVHMSNILSKLDASSRTEAILVALRKGWISLQDTK